MHQGAKSLDEDVCALARTVSVIGDKWTLQILGDCFQRVRRFEDFLSRLGISRAMLADRLQKLVDNFILTRVAYQQNPTRYEYRLTPKGLDLYPIIMTMTHWADVHMTGRKGRPAIHVHHLCHHQFDPMLVCSECTKELSAKQVTIVPRPGAAAKRASSSTHDYAVDELASAAWSEFESKQA
jgi:DNA-binding HxlR family transcriptional regulator